MDLTTAVLGREYTIRDVTAEDEEMVSFLFSLGCYSGEPITVISRRGRGCTVAIKDARYHIDRRLAQSILV
ncbi:MAG: ferrous iron transport protein A [Clostridia bacterium]|nr:ferrous iron transport protein A [Clostridia bacterium]